MNNDPPFDFYPFARLPDPPADTPPRTPPQTPPQSSGEHQGMSATATAPTQVLSRSSGNLLVVPPSEVSDNVTRMPSPSQSNSNAIIERGDRKRKAVEESLSAPGRSSKKKHTRSASDEFLARSHAAVELQHEQPRTPNKRKKEDSDDEEQHDHDGGTPSKRRRNSV